MRAIRARDFRAILFCVVTSLLIAAGVFLVAHSVIVAAALTGAWLAWLLSRRRMRRVIRRLRGEPEDDGWGGYFRN